MSDVIFIGVTIAFFAICTLYVQWCDRIIGPDEFGASGDEPDPVLDTVLDAVPASASRTSEVTP